MIHGKAVPYLLGDPSLPPDREYVIRERLTARALTTLTLDVSEPTVFSAE